MTRTQIALGLAASVMAVALLNVRSSAAAPAAPVRSGEAIYKDKCVYCHDTRGWATRALARRVDPAQAMIVARTDLPADFVKAVVRRGIGSMPAFTPTDLNDAEVASVAAWLAAPKAPSPPKPK